MTYRRTTTGGTYDFGASDERENLHWLSSYEVQAPSVHDRLSGPLVVRGRFEKPDGPASAGAELYVSAVLVSDYGAVRRFELRDHGLGHDEKPGTAGTRAATSSCAGRSSSATSASRTAPACGTCSPSRRTSTPSDQGTDPFTAAHTIGGFVLTNQLELAFDEPCRLRRDAVVQVV